MQIHYHQDHNNTGLSQLIWFIQYLGAGDFKIGEMSNILEIIWKLVRNKNKVYLIYSSKLYK